MRSSFGSAFYYYRNRSLIQRGHRVAVALLCSLMSCADIHWDTETVEPTDLGTIASRCVDGILLVVYQPQQPVLGNRASSSLVVLVMVLMMMSPTLTSNSERPVKTVEN